MGFTNLDIIERVHLKFCKLLLNLKKSTPNFIVYGELGAYPMQLYVHSRMVNFWSKLVNEKESKLSSIMYKYTYYHFVRNQYQSPWVVAIKNILNSTGFSNLWEFQGNFSQKWLNMSLKQRLTDQFQQKWRSDIENSSKGMCYKLFKHNFEFEKYLETLPNKDANTFCRFRAGNHRLPIETGRWQNIERQNRYCTLCDSLEIGDEFHCVLACRALRDERKECLDSYYLNRINILKFGQLFQLKNKSKLKKLCKLLRIINVRVSPLG